MADREISDRMREDWNSRAREDAGYFVAFGRKDQDEAGFQATAKDVIIGLEWELKRAAAEKRTGWKALEIGCGPGRLILPMSRHFAEIHGVDVSDEMIARAKEKLKDVPNAHVHATDGASLRLFENESFDFVYSYAVFQHIPSREVVFEYMSEINRVLKPGGLARLQFNGLPRSESIDAGYTTWAGARLSGMELLEFAQSHKLQVLTLEGVATQYMWTTWRKPPSVIEPPAGPTLIRRITNANSSEPVAPSRGRFACISLWVENLPEDAGLEDLHVRIGDSLGTITYIGPADHSRLQQVSVILPELEATGLLPVELLRGETLLAPPAILRVIPPGPSVPRIHSISDGVNLVEGTRIETRSVKMTLEEIARPYEIEARVDGLPVESLEYFCIDPRPQRYEVNFRLPEEIAAGPHSLEVQIGRRKLGPVALDVAPVQSN
jgi:ubiquinone/menaquinone biosynthesis C-methylase UbiE